MLSIFIWVFIFIASLAALVKFSEYFVNSAEKIGLSAGLSPFIIGVTIVAFGTSLPELISSIFSVLRGASEIVVANVMGSNISNVFLILGITSVMAPTIITMEKKLIKVDLPLLACATLLFTFFISDKVFSVGEIVLSLAGLLVFLLYSIKENVEAVEENVNKLKKNELLQQFGLLLVSCLFIYFGAKYTVEAIIKISELLHIGKEIIAGSAVALGTSLPELVVSVQAGRKGKPEIAIGNILGSNIFNLFAVMGIPALFGSLVISSTMLTFSLPMLLAATFLFSIITMGNHITRWEGLMLLMFYIFYIGTLYGFI